ncbi:hypothetical protein NKH18_00600 [Streptomyces sp. M10(2022)]
MRGEGHGKERGPGDAQAVAAAVRTPRRPPDLWNFQIIQRSPGQLSREARRRRK